MSNVPEREIFLNLCATPHSHVNENFMFSHISRSVGSFVEQ